MRCMTDTQAERRESFPTFGIFSQSRKHMDCSMKGLKMRPQPQFKAVIIVQLIYQILKCMTSGTSFNSLESSPLLV